MTTPTREQIEAAYDVLEELYYAACALNLHGSHDSEEEWHSAILKVLPPKPRPTMAKVEWDDDEHYLAEAEHKSCGKVIMLGPDEEGLIEFFIPEACASRYDAAYPGSLTLTGRRYELAEVQDD